MQEQEFTFQAAVRAKIKPLIGVYGKSGSGKTMSALLLARGMVGKNGRVAMLDTENGRGSLFADLIPGGYNTLQLDEPFSPERYTATIEAAEKQADVLVIDSMSHEWAGDGGILDWQEAELQRMAGDDWKKREQCKMAAWIKPKSAHKKMVMRILRSSIPIICCLRAEEKTHIQKGQGGDKTKVITDEFTTPLFDSRFIFEMLINLETVARNAVGGFANIVKVTHPDLWECLPSENDQIGEKHGRLIAEWCAGKAGGSAPQKPQQSTADNSEERKAARKALFTAMRSKYSDFDDRLKGNVDAIQEELWQGFYLLEGETLESCTSERLFKIAEKIATE